jgi:hypothetical protein
MKDKPNILSYHVEPPEPIDPDSVSTMTQRAGERYFLLRRTKRFEAKLKNLEARTNKNAPRGAGIRSHILSAKTKHPAKASKQLFIARYVDERLKKEGTKPEKAFPQGWLKYNPPLSLAEVITNPGVNPKLKKLAKSYISKI